MLKPSSSPHIDINTVLFEVSPRLPRVGNNDVSFRLRFCKMNGCIICLNLAVHIKKEFRTSQRIGKRNKGTILLFDLDNNRTISIRVGGIMEYNGIKVTH